MRGAGSRGRQRIFEIKMTTIAGNFFNACFALLTHE
jgi:hypothetical protein